MRLHRFYVQERVGEKTKLTISSADLVNQIRRVFRLKKGDRVVIFDGSGSDYECTIDNDIERSRMIPINLIDISVVEQRPSVFMPTREVILCASIVKKDNFELIVEKATELGVTKIIPIISERSEKKSLNEARLMKISIEASEQSGRGNIPVILPIMSLEDVVKEMRSNKIPSLIFHTQGEILPSGITANKEPVAVFIGPEGGWAEGEILMFHAQEGKIVCLGKQVLRAETAVIAALSRVLL